MRVMRTLMVMRCTPWRHPEPEMTTIATLTAQRDALQAEWDALIGIERQTPGFSPGSSDGGRRAPISAASRSGAASINFASALACSSPRIT